jgi:hypothetical protein
MAVELPDSLFKRIERPFDGQLPIPVYRATVAAFVGRTQRGPLNKAVAVGSFEEFCRIFGGHSSYSYLSYTVQQYFQHGGAQALIVRVANRATCASLELPAGTQTLHLEARDPGSHCYLRVSVDYDGLDADSSRFNLVVQRVTRPGSQLVEDQELFHSLSIDEADTRFVAHVLEGSVLVRLARPLPIQRPEATVAARPGYAIPYVAMKANGTDGDEISDYDIIGSNEEGTGLFAVDPVDPIDLLCIPPSPSGRDLGITTFLAAERYCGRRNAMLVWDAPSSWSSPDAALMNLRQSGFASPNVITYYPRVRLAERNGRILPEVPASGVVAGLLSHSDQAGVWRRLDEAETQLKAGLSIAHPPTTRQALMLQRAGINVFTRTARGPFELQGNVTLAGSRVVSQFWQRIDRRRLEYFILTSVSQHTAWSYSRPRDVALWQALFQQVSLFLTELFDQGALVGQRPSQAFTVKIGPGLQESKSELLIRIGIAIERPGEFQFHDIVHSKHGSTTRHSPTLAATERAG